MQGLVVAAARLVSAGLGRYAIIGGVAVNARLPTAHRATADLDTVVDEETHPDALEVLANLAGATRDPNVPHRIHVEGTKIEVIGTGAITESSLEGIQPLEVLFVAGHRWALETASQLTLVKSDRCHRATVPVAMPAALVAMKLHAIQDRRGSRSDKRAGDAWDLYRLLDQGLPDARLAAELSHAVVHLRDATIEATGRLFIDDAARTRTWLSHGDERMRAVTPNDLTAVAQAFLTQVQR